MTFRHTFQTGLTATLTVDMTGEIPSVVCDPTPLPEECFREYARWRDEVIAPAIFAAMTREQKIEMATPGMHVLGFSDEQIDEISKFGGAE